jgi:hypothetical protein
MTLSAHANANLLALCSGALLGIALRTYASPDPPDQQQHLIETSETSALPPYVTVREGSTDKNSIPAYEAMWALFAAVSGMEGKQATSGRTLLIDDVGLNANAADGLHRYMRDAFEDIRTRAVQVREQTCAQRNRLTSRDALAERLVQTDEALDRRREAHVSNMQKIIAPDEQAKVAAWVDENVRTTMRITSFDYAIYLDHEQVTPEEFLDRLCDPPSQASE